MKAKAIVSLLVLFAIALAGCQDDDDGGETTTTTPAGGTTSPTATTGGGTTATTTSATETPPRDPVTWDVSVEDNEFSAAELTIQAGDTVRWTQTGTNPHTVTATDGSFDSHPDCSTGAVDGPLGNCMAEGDTYEQTFTETTDAFVYYCKLHGSEDGSGMGGTITVLARYNETPSA